MYLSDDQKRFGHLPKMRQRCHARDLIDFHTIMSTDSEARIDVRLTNISPSGVCARSKILFQRGTRIRILIPMMGDVEAFIAWSLPGCFGANFTHSVRLGQYPHLLAAIKSA